MSSRDDNWILCVVRNGLSLTREAVRSFRDQSIPTRVLLVDNGSTDETPRWAQSGDLDYVRIQPSSVSDSWNFGLDYLFGNKKASRVLVVNNDVYLRSDTYELLAFSGHGFCTAVGREDWREVASA